MTACPAHWRIVCKTAICAESALTIRDWQAGNQHHTIGRARLLPGYKLPFISEITLTDVGVSIACPYIHIGNLRAKLEYEHKR